MTLPSHPDSNAFSHCANHSCHVGQETGQGGQFAASGLVAAGYRLAVKLTLEPTLTTMPATGFPTAPVIFFYVVQSPSGFRIDDRA